MLIHFRTVFPVLALAALVGCEQTSTVNVISLLRVTRQENVDARRYEVERETQQLLIRSPFVLANATRELQATNPDLFAGIANPQKWLADRITVDCPGNSEIIRVQFRAETDDLGVVILDTIVESYLSEVVQRERSDLVEKLSHLRQSQRQKTEALRDAVNKIGKLKKALGTSDPDLASINLKIVGDRAQMLLQRIGAVEQKLLDARIAAAESKSEQEPASVSILKEELARMQTEYKQCVSDLRELPQYSAELETEKLALEALEAEIQQLSGQVAELERRFQTPHGVVLVQPAIAHR